MTAPRYVELQVTTNYSFLEGGSHPSELVATAAALGLSALGVTDRNSLAGVVRAHVAARDLRQSAPDFRLLIGARLDFTDHPSLLCYPEDRAAYGRLARLLTLGRRRVPKGQCELGIEDFFDHAEGQLVIALPGTDADQLGRLREACRDRLWLAATHGFRGDEARRFGEAAAIARAARAPLIATNDVLYHAPHRRALQDVLTCARTHTTIAEAGFALEANAERHLKHPGEMARLFAAYPEAIAATVDFSARCRFSLDELGHRYPDEAPEDGRTPQQRLSDLAWEGAAAHYGEVPEKVRGLISHELALIEQLGYAAYFLTVHDIVRFARDRGILCQGRGSAANSAVCFALGVTAVDPARLDVLFERFISAERREPPDIDVDFEHERREEVIQHIYEKYGRDHAGMTAAISCFRARGAVREVAKVMGLSLDSGAKLAESVWGWSAEAIDEEKARAAGLDPRDPMVTRTLDLARQLIGFPRHLSQHVGGFVITRDPLDSIVPVTNAAMADRTVIEWDKDDLDALGILKIDVLALGMLSCVRRAFDMIAAPHAGRSAPKPTLATVPAEDPEVYEMLSRADSIGVFQVESRAQMTMLPRLKPRCFYDLVIEVAIVRPGPIQGDMVHPYLRRRSGREAVSYPSEDLRAVLGKTLGVPLFQEQAMRIAIVAAGFTPSEADQLRRAMATFRNVGTIHKFGQKMIEGMVARGYERDFAERCFRQIEGFGTYGFPESHAASFALIVYVSAWLKRHHPAIFAAALINSQPMGFYAPAQIARDAAEHGVTLRPIDINHSDWDCTLEPDPASHNGLALRLGLRLVKGLNLAAAERLVAARGAGYGDLHAVWRRSGVPAALLAKLAAADGFGSLGLDRRRAEWAVRGLGEAPLPLFAAGGPLAEQLPEPATALPAMPLGRQVVTDYSVTGLSLKRHPLALLRLALEREYARDGGLVTAASLAKRRAGARLQTAGLVLVRQRPGTAKGVIFITIEDEGGVANLIVLPPVFAKYRRVVMTASLLVAQGRLESQEGVIHLLVDRLIDRSDLLRQLGGEAGVAMPEGQTTERAIARADEIRRTAPDPREAAADRFRRLSRDFH